VERWLRNSSITRPISQSNRTSKKNTDICINNKSSIVVTAKTLEYYSKEEYITRAMESTVKLEYHDGLIVEAMAGGTSEHSKIKTDTLVFLAGNTKKCQTFDSNMAVKIEAHNRYVYPDMSFVCGEDTYEDDRRIFLLNPSLIIEVLSPKTKDIDRGEKFMWYRSIPSFKEYVLIQSESMNVESWYKEEENLWRIQPADKLAQSIRLFTLDIDLPLEEIYKRVHSS